MAALSDVLASKNETSVKEFFFNAVRDADVTTVTQMLDNETCKLPSINLTVETLNEHDVYRRTAVQMASSAGHVELAKVLVERYHADFYDQIRDANGMTALMVAAWHGHADLVAYFVEVLRKKLDKATLLKVFRVKSDFTGKRALELAGLATEEVTEEAKNATLSILLPFYNEEDD